MQRLRRSIKKISSRNKSSATTHSRSSSRAASTAESEHHGRSRESQNRPSNSGSSYGGGNAVNTYAPAVHIASRPPSSYKAPSLQPPGVNAYSYHGTPSRTPSYAASTSASRSHASQSTIRPEDPALPPSSEGRSTSSRRSSASQSTIRPEDRPLPPSSAGRSSSMSRQGSSHVSSRAPSNAPSHALSRASSVRSSSQASRSRPESQASTVRPTNQGPTRRVIPASPASRSSADSYVESRSRFQAPRFPGTLGAGSTTLPTREVGPDDSISAVGFARPSGHRAQQSPSRESSREITRQSSHLSQTPSSPPENQHRRRGTEWYASYDASISRRGTLNSNLYHETRENDGHGGYVQSTYQITRHDTHHRSNSQGDTRWPDYPLYRRLP